jgi:hypothetical protein
MARPLLPQSYFAKLRETAPATAVPVTAVTASRPHGLESEGWSEGLAALGGNQMKTKIAELDLSAERKKVARPTFVLFAAISARFSESRRSTLLLRYFHTARGSSRRRSMFPSPTGEFRNREFSRQMIPSVPTLFRSTLLSFLPSILDRRASDHNNLAFSENRRICWSPNPTHRVRPSPRLPLPT